MSLRPSALQAHTSHLMSPHAPFCEKCAARGTALVVPCPIGEDALDQESRANPPEDSDSSPHTVPPVPTTPFDREAAALLLRDTAQLCDIQAERGDTRRVGAGDLLRAVAFYLAPHVSLGIESTEATERAEAADRRAEAIDNIERRIANSYVTNCVIVVRDGDGPLFNDPDALVRLDRYTILPREQYDELTQQLQEIREAWDEYAASPEAPEGDAVGDNFLRLALLLQDIRGAAESRLATPEGSNG